MADFVEQFSPQTGVRPIAFEELQAVFEHYYDGGEEARVPLWSLYEGLLAFLLAVRYPPPFLSFASIVRHLSLSP